MHSAFWERSSLARAVPTDNLGALAQYVLEALPEIREIVSQAQIVLRDNTEDGALYGYAAASPPDRVYQEVRAIYEYLQSRRSATGRPFSYVLDPCEFDPVRGQRVRLAREVLHWGQGTCIDWVLLVAGCLYHASIWPMIGLTTTHAVVGYWTEEPCPDRPEVIPECDLKHLVNTGQVVLVNATRIPAAENGSHLPFDAAVQEARTHIPHLVSGIDIRAARLHGICAAAPVVPFSANHTLKPAAHYQERSELASLTRWWSSPDSYGVFSFVGLGGCGKTALLSRFRSSLVPEPSASLAPEREEEPLVAPDALFVWDFAQDPDPDKYATALTGYLSDEAGHAGSFAEVQELLTRRWMGCRVLIILDSLEVLQISPHAALEDASEEERDLNGRFPALLRFLEWCCETPLPVRVVCASRIDIAALHRFVECGGFTCCSIGGLSATGARQLLRDHGVRGADAGIDSIAGDFGGHPLSLDLLGHLLNTQYDGDLRGVDEMPPLAEVRAISSGRGMAAAFGRVLDFYLGKLPRSSCLLLQLLSAFHMISVDIHDLCRIARGTGLSRFANLSEDEVRAAAASLELEYFLLQRAEPQQGNRAYKVTPSLRDYFFEQLAKQGGIQRIHHAIVCWLKERNCASSLTTQLGKLRGGRLLYFKPVAEGCLDEIEELVRHMIAVGQINPAWSLYFLGMGGYVHLAADLGLVFRGSRIARQFASSRLPIDVTAEPVEQLKGMVALERLRGLFWNEEGLYVLSVGDTANAIGDFSKAAQIHLDIGNVADATSNCANLCEAYLMQGNLVSATDTAAFALETLHGRQPDDFGGWEAGADWYGNKAIPQLANAPAFYQQLSTLSAYIGYVLFLRGKSRQSLFRFVEAMSYQSLLQQRDAAPVVTAVIEALMDGSARKSRTAPEEGNARTFRLLEKTWGEGFLTSIAGVYFAATLLREGATNLASKILEGNRALSGTIARNASYCDAFLAEAARLQGDRAKAQQLLRKAEAWARHTGSTELLVLTGLFRARFALEGNDLVDAGIAIHEALRVAEACSYGIHRIDLLIARGRWQMAYARRSLEEGPLYGREAGPNEWFGRASESALQALKGNVSQTNSPLLGACDRSCDYIWGQVDAYVLLAESLLARAQRTPELRFTLLDSAHQAAMKCVRLQEEIRDRRLPATRDLLERIVHARNATVVP